MKQVSQRDYFEMRELGMIDYREGSRNCAIVGRQKPSRARSYYVEDRVLESFNLMKSSERN